MVSKKNTKKNVKRNTLKSKKSRRVPLRKSKRSTKVGKRANKKYQKGGAAPNAVPNAAPNAALTVPDAGPQVRADGTVRVTKKHKYSGHDFYNRKPIENWLNTYLTTYTKGIEGFEFDIIMLKKHYDEYKIRKKFVENFVKNHARIMRLMSRNPQHVVDFNRKVSIEPSTMTNERDETHIKNVDIKEVQELLYSYGISVDKNGKLKN